MEVVMAYQPVSEGLVWRILHLYASTSRGTGSQIDRFGEPAGRPSQSSLEWAGTVGQKLARAPLVESVLWLHEAADWLRNQAPEYRRAKGSPFAGEPFALQAMLVKSSGDARWCDGEANRRKRTGQYGREMLLLEIEFSTCMETDAAFRAKVDGR